MQGKDTTQSTINQLLDPILDEQILNWLKENLDIDKYVKKLTLENFLVLIILAQLQQLQGLRDISSSLNDDHLSKALGLESISHSQISRKLGKLPTQALQGLFRHLINRAGTQMSFKKVHQFLGRIHLIDSSTISLSLTRYPWAEFKKTKSGIKLHLRLRFFEQGVLPTEAIITPARPADKTQMDNIVVEDEGAINVFDRAYVDYSKFDAYCEKDVRFVTRLKSNAVKEVIKEHPVEEGGNIKRDCVAILGKGPKRMKHPLRLMETEDTEGNAIVILTNDFNISAEELGDIYRHRWQIELFFKWIKQHLHVKHFYGLSDQAVENQLYIALITYCLLTLLKARSDYKGSLLEIKRLVENCLYQSYNEFLRRLKRKSSRSSLGRRKIDHETVFNETYRQVMSGGAEFLDDLTYDPVIL